MSAAQDLGCVVWKKFDINGEKGRLEILLRKSGTELSSSCTFTADEQPPNG